MTEPAVVIDGLALYSRGDGPPVLLVPDPQGFALAPAIDGPLATLLARGLEREVLTFDPPGAFRSRRRPRLGLGEMLDCIEEMLAAIGVHRRIDVLAHGQATLVALAHAMERPDRVRRLVLVGAVDPDSSAIGLARRLPWGWRDARFWRFQRLAAALALGLGSLARQKRLVQLMTEASFADRGRAPHISPDPGDEHLPASRRARWRLRVRHPELFRHLRRVRCPTLVCVGRYDPLSSVRGAAAIAAGIPDARLAVFESSGHFPFVEEPEHFRAEIGGFLR